jgi:hypothetical protein
LLRILRSQDKADSGRDWGKGNRAGCSFSRLREKVPQADEGLLILILRIPDPQSRIPDLGCSFSRLREKVPQADEGLWILIRQP